MRATNFFLSIRRLESSLVYLWFHIIWQSLTLLQICFLFCSICPDFFCFSVALFLICLSSFHFRYPTLGRWIYLYDWAKATSWLKLANHMTICFVLSIIIHSLILLFSLYYAVWCHEASTYFFLTCTDAFLNLPDMMSKFNCANNKIE